MQALPAPAPAPPSAPLSRPAAVAAGRAPRSSSCGTLTPGRTASSQLVPARQLAQRRALLGRTRAVQQPAVAELRLDRPAAASVESAGSDNAATADDSRNGGSSGGCSGSNSAAFAPASPRLPRDVSEAERRVVESDLGFETIPQMWQTLACRHGDLMAVVDKHHSPPYQLTYAQLEAHIAEFGAGLRAWGAGPGRAVALFAEGSARWLISDQGIMATGAVGAVRGASAPAEELAYILRNSQAVGLVIESAAALRRLLPQLTGPVGPAAAELAAGGLSSGPLLLEFIVILQGDPPAADGAGSTAEEAAMLAALPCPVLAFDQVMAAGRGAGLPALCCEGGLPAAPAEPSRPRLPHVCRPEAIATLVYTSGTTGRPKGAALTHANLMYQLRCFPTVVAAQRGDRALSLLPPWHCYERTVLYYILSRGMEQTVSNVKRFREDLEAAVRAGRPPHFLVCVPLVLESLHKRVMATISAASPLRRAIAMTLLGAAVARVRAMRTLKGLALPAVLPAALHALQHAPASDAAPAAPAVLARPQAGAALVASLARGLARVLSLARAALLAVALAPAAALGEALVFRSTRSKLGIIKAAVSGGGALTPALDDFFEAIGLCCLNGWGLTECSPVLAVRTPTHNPRGTIGRPLPGTRLKVVDPATRQPLAAPADDGAPAVGLILARGPGVMARYHRDEAATARAIDHDGYFDTGDLGYVAPAAWGPGLAGSVVLVGRAKDTIVLSNGENVEPQPLEDRLLASPLVAQLMLVGQNHKQLGALVVPDVDALAAALKAKAAAASGGAKAAAPAVVGPGTALPFDAAAAAALLRDDFAARLKDRPGVEQVGRVALVAPWTSDSGELTQTLKLRRDVIAGRLAATIEALFA